jgi:preprotein translocase subunit SecB
MNASPLQLSSYFVSDLALTANRDYNKDKPILLSMEHLAVETEFIQNKDDIRKWQVQVKIQQKPVPDTNAPYSFLLEMVGFFDIAKKYPEAKIEAMVKTNGPSVLYGAAREILRTLMSHGPFCPIILPTGSFYTPDLVEKFKTKPDQTKKLEQSKRKPD